MSLHYKFGHITEDTLINGCINNDRKCQEVLYKQYFDKMYAMCMRYTQDESIICGIINDGFLTVFKNIKAFEQRGSFEGWIRRIVFNTMADHFRKENKRIKFLQIPDEAKDIISFQNDFHDYDEILSKIDTLVGSYKSVFILYAIEGFSHREIASQLDISENTSKWYLAEAKKKLQQLIIKTENNWYYGK